MVLCRDLAISMPLLTWLYANVTPKQAHIKTTSQGYYHCILGFASPKKIVIGFKKSKPVCPFFNLYNRMIISSVRPSLVLAQF